MGWELAIIISFGSALGSLWLTRFILLRLPADYFTTEEPRGASSRLAWVARNVAALMLFLLGLVLALPGVPGQGVLTMAVGLLIADLPGKHKLERRLLGHDRILAMINAVRDRAGIPPLLPPNRSPS